MLSHIFPTDDDINKENDQIEEIVSLVDSYRLLSSSYLTKILATKPSFSNEHIVAVAVLKEREADHDTLDQS